MERSNWRDLTLTLYRVRRAWDELAATWKLARSGQPWGVAGCDGLTADRDETAFASLPFPAPGQALTVDVTELVRDWQAHPDGNNGLLLKGVGGVSVEYSLASFEHSDVTLRPKLVVQCSVAVPTPTPTVAATPTAIPGSVAFLTGEDTTISSWYPDQACGLERELMVRQGDTIASLLRFDLTGLPAGSTIELAKLRLYVLDRTNPSDLEVSLYRALRYWDAYQSTWVNAVSNIPWEVAGCNGLGIDRVAQAVSSATLKSAGQWVTLDVTELVAYWAAHPGQNYGMVLKGDETGSSVGYSLASMNYDVPLARPQLLVRYTGGAPTPTPTRTPTRTATPAQTKTATPVQTPVSTKTATPAPSTNTAVFKVDGDAALNEWGPDTCYGSDPRLPVRTFGAKRPIFHFDLSNLPPNAVVQRATFRARATGSDNIPLVVDAVGLLRGWSEWHVTWNRPRTGESWGSPGASAGGSDRLALATSSSTIYAREEWYEWDVTTLAQDWASGKLTNHGLMLVCNDTSRQYQITLTGREGGQLAELVVEYRVEVPQSHTLHLYEGMNLISLPVLPADPSVAAVFGPVMDRVIGIWTHDPADATVPRKLFEAENAALTGLEQLDVQHAYWVQMSAAADLTVTGKSAEGTALALKRGENMVGYPSLTARDIAAALGGVSSKVELVWSYDASDPSDPWKRYVPRVPPWTNDLYEFAPGRGYWIQVSEDCALQF